MSQHIGGIDTQAYPDMAKAVLPPDSGGGSDNWTPEQWLEFRLALNRDLPKTQEQWFKKLASLSPVEYDQQRGSVASRLGIRISTLDAEVDKLRTSSSGHGSQDGDPVILQEPEPWESVVDGLELLNAIRTVFEKYIILPAGAAVTLALWVLHTYLLDAADASPIVGISSPEKRCGKTAVLELLGTMVYRPLPAANITAAALFRTIEAYKPTLLIDEADTFIRDKEELRGVLNSGHRRASAIVIRTTGDNHEPKTFSTWCPKAIALIGKLPGTLQDRSIVIQMRRKSHAERVERIRHSLLAGETQHLQRKTARWADDNLEHLRHADPNIPETLNDRAADCWRPLFAIADRVGGDWPELARSASQSLSTDDDSAKVQLLTDIRDIFTAANADKMFSETLVAEVIKMEDRPWPEWKSGKPMTKSQLAHILRGFDIVVKTVRIDATTQKGYRLEQFDDAFFRYLGSQNVTPSQSTPVLSCDVSQNVTPKIDVTFPKTSQPTPVLGCDGVTFLNHLTDEKGEKEGDERL